MSKGSGKATWFLVAAGVCLLGLAVIPRGGRGESPVTTVIYRHALPTGQPPTSGAPAMGVEGTTTPTSTTLAGAGDTRGVDSQEQTQRLTRVLPHDTARWGVDYDLHPDGSLSLKVRVKAVLNRPDQRPQYETDLRAFKAEAVAWLTGQGVDVTKVAVAWTPPEAASL
jgi:hypothetical protein